MIIGADVHWPDVEAPLLLLDAALPLAEAAPRVERFMRALAREPQGQLEGYPWGPWVVIRTAGGGTGGKAGDLWHVVDAEELAAHVADPMRPTGDPISEHLALAEREASQVALGHPRPDGVKVQMGDDLQRSRSDTHYRVLHLDEGGAVRSVGRLWMLLSGAPPPMAIPDEPMAARGPGLGAIPTLGTLGMGDAPERARSRGIEPDGPREAAAPAPDAEDAASPSESTFQATLSAQGPSVMEPGQREFVEVRIERDDDDAMPLEHAVGGVDVQEGEPIQVMLSVRGSAVRVLGSRRLELTPPAPGRASVGEFEVEARDDAEGEVHFGISFRQMGSELGAVRLSVSVVSARPPAAAPRLEEAEAPPRARAREAVTALPRDPDDDAILRLLIDEMEEDGRTFFRYRLISEPLGLHYLTVDSRPLLDRDGGSAGRLDDYVARIHDKLTRDLRRRSDLAQFQVELEAAGVSLCRELLSPDVARVLWPLRSRIEGVQITSWEPRIPWEVVRLQEPDSGEVDDRYLAEYGLVRTFHGRTPPRELALERWTFLAATYPHGTEASVTTEVDFLTRFLPDQGVDPERLAPGFEPLWRALSEGGFDVLHLACHGLSDPGQIQNAALLIGDRPGAEEGDPPEPIRIEAESVRGSRALWAERPLVFLHACEAGRHGLGLTEWGGWPTAFMEAGAGAFVGASWPVRDQPAGVFANAFYQALWHGATLSEAAQAARREGRELGDASWLAFKVYGHPGARRRGSRPRQTNGGSPTLHSGSETLSTEP